jgi:hypothetical protein
MWISVEGSLPPRVSLYLSDPLRIERETGKEREITNRSIIPRELRRASEKRAGHPVEFSGAKVATRDGTKVLEVVMC